MIKYRAVMAPRDDESSNDILVMSEIHRKGLPFHEVVEEIKDLQKVLSLFSQKVVSELSNIFQGSKHLSFDQEIV